MIISASRRTDIPAYFSNWFLQRIKEGFVYVRNPRNAHQISKVILARDVVDGIVFWTKNPIPMMNRLDEIKHYPYYFQITLNPYGKDIEPNVPSKGDVIIPAFKELSNKIGKHRLVWRYDPIFLNSKYTLEYHYKYFEILLKKLCSHTEKCTVSFLNYYKKTEYNMKNLHIKHIEDEQKHSLISNFISMASTYGLKLDTCAENISPDLPKISPARCIDKKIFEKISGYPLNIAKDKAQRLRCGCIASIDIGAYNTCKHGCLYCYANFNQMIVENNFSQHNFESSVLLGEIKETDKIIERKMKSCQDYCKTLYDT